MCRMFPGNVHRKSYIVICIRCFMTFFSDFVYFLYEYFERKNYSVIYRGAHGCIDYIVTKILRDAISRLSFHPQHSKHISLLKLGNEVEESVQLPIERERAT